MNPQYWCYKCDRYYDPVLYSHELIVVERDLSGAVTEFCTGSTGQLRISSESDDISEGDMEYVRKSIGVGDEND